MIQEDPVRQVNTLTHRGASTQTERENKREKQWRRRGGLEDHDTVTHPQPLIHVSK